MADHLVEPGGDSQGVFQIIPRAKLAVQMVAVPVVPLVQRDADVFALERFQRAPVAAVGVGLQSHSLRHLADVGDQVGFFAAVEMLADQVHVIGTMGHHALAPGAGRADRHELDRGVFRAHGIGKHVVLLDVLLQRHVPELPAAVHLVADAPPLDPVRLGVAVFSAEATQGRVRGAVGVLELLDGRGHLALTAVDDHQRLGIELAAQEHELVEPEIVVLHARPGRVLSRRPAVAVADPVAPVVAADKVAARPTVDGRVEVL